MSVQRLQGPDGRIHEVLTEWDSGREMWRFRGLGFDFLAYPVLGEGEFPDFEGVTAGFQAEVSRQENGGGTVAVWIGCPSSGLLTDDLFVSKCIKELGQYWDLFGELEEG
jgi:hypothetical protein